MPANGYSLIELLIVIVIMSVIGVVGYVNYKQFAATQVTTNAVAQIQSILRLAQTNASSSTVCLDGVNNNPWSISFNVDQTSIILGCGPLGTQQKVYSLQNARIDSIVPSANGCTNVGLPFTISYDNSGSLNFTSNGTTSTCLQSPTWMFTVKNVNDNNFFKIFNVSKGGAVNVQ